LINRYGSASDALEALPEILNQQGKASRVMTRSEAEDELERAARYGVRFIGMGEPDYPHLLRIADSCPPMIGIRGHVHILSRPSVAIVGSRNASAVGLKLAEMFAEGLSRHHCVVISGLARGIDAAAHRASLRTGTVAVLAGGHDKIYPPEHRDLLDVILENGAAISEMPMGWEPRGRDFPRRNRIISGLSHGVVLVEAAMQSGSLITARFAAEQGRDVFAIPGSPLDPRSDGTNDLIRNGATLVTSPDHVIEALAPIIGRRDWPPGALETGSETHEPLWDELDLFSDYVPLTAFENGRAISDLPHLLRTEIHASLNIRKVELLALIGPSPIAIDDLVRLSGMPTRIVQALLLELELEVDLIRHGAGLVSTPPSRSSLSS
jgi:DNA processing protein